MFEREFVRSYKNETTNFAILDSVPAALSALSISLVTFEPHVEVLTAVIDRLLTALHHAAMNGVLTAASLVVVDNGPALDCRLRLQRLLEAHWNDSGFASNIISGHGNIGYGQGHNKAIEQSTSDYHLILNPDVLVAEGAISNAIEFMDENPGVGLLAPAVVAEDSQLMHLCKDYPTVLDLALRGFAPPFAKAYAHKRLARYEMRDMDPYRVHHSVPLISGSFMFFRRRVLELTGGFSSAYFLYFEDFDLSVRAAEFATVSYVPSVQIVHKGGHARKKGIRHWWMFCRSAYTFFSHHGWKWY
jgi:GT2 family glycosyltransferase